MSASNDGQTKPDRLVPPEDAALSDRLRRLSKSLQERKVEETAGGGGSPQTDASGYARAFRLASEFLGGIVAGGLLGWVVDHFAGTRPFGLLVFLLLGFAAGTLNVIRISGAAVPTGDGAGTEK